MRRFSPTGNRPEHSKSGEGGSRRNRQPRRFLVTYRVDDSAVRRVQRPPLWSSRCFDILHRS